MRRHTLSVVAYVGVTLSTQALSHFMVAADHYAAVAFLRNEPIAVLGLLAALSQGLVITWLYSRTRQGTHDSVHALAFSVAVGVVLVSYTSFAEAAKYEVPSAASWVAVELASGLVQFGLFGLALGLIYRDAPRGQPA